MQFMRGIPEKWKELNPVLEDGQPGFERVENEIYRLKIGDGHTPWNELPYIGESTNLEALLMDHINNSDIHVSPEDREKWDKGGGSGGTGTDEKVSQINISDNLFKPIILGYNSITDGELKEITEKVYQTLKIYANPSEGYLYAVKFIGDIDGTADNAINDENGNPITDYIKDISLDEKDGLSLIISNGNNEEEIITISPKYEELDESSELNNMKSGETVGSAFSKISLAIKKLISHLKNTNVHVTQDDKDNWNNKADREHDHEIADINNLEESLSNKANKEHKHEIADINNLKDTLDSKADLGEDGKVLSSQLPSYVDDVIDGYYHDKSFYEDSSYQKLITPESGKIYIDLISLKTYRWSGSTYAEISASLALGTTSNTAFRGDHGKTAYDHATNANATSDELGLYKIKVNSYGHVIEKEEIESLPNAYSLFVKNNGTEFLKYDGSLDKSLNFKPGSNISLSSDSSGNVTIDSDHPDITLKSGSSSGGSLLPGGSFTLIKSITRDDYGHIIDFVIDNEILPSSANTLFTARKIDGVLFNGSKDINHYGECTTDAETMIKEVECEDFTLVSGSEITVKFKSTNTNTSPRLNVNGTGAKFIYYNGSSINYASLIANKVYRFVYDGTVYNLVGDMDDFTVLQRDSSSDYNFPLLLGANVTGDTKQNTWKNSIFTANPYTGELTATKFIGELDGNAATATSAITATKFNSSQTIKLTGDITGSASSQAGWSIDTTLTDSGVTAGTYGPSTDLKPDHGSSFTIPQITVDAKGRTTGIIMRKVTLPADNNTDIKVRQKLTTENETYPLMLCPAGQTADSDTIAYFDSGVTLNPNTNTIAANISGNAVTATSATRAIQDGNGASIADTYAKQANVQELAITVGNNTAKITTLQNNLGNYLPLAGGTMNKDAEIITQRTIDERLVKYGASGMKFIAPNSAWATAYYFYNYGGSTSMGGIGAFGTSSAITYYYMGPSYDKPLFKLDTSGNATFTGAVSAKTFSTNSEGYGLSTGTYAGTAGTNGYVKIAQIKIAATYKNSPIMIVYTQRGETELVYLTISFNNENNTDPSLKSFTQFGSSIRRAYIVKSATSTWDIYVGKSEAYDSISVLYYSVPKQMDGTTLILTDAQASSVPSGYTQASIGGTVAVATSASKLSNTSAIGSTTKPVYFTANGVPAAISYELGGACTKAVKNMTVVGNTDWTSTTEDAKYVPTMNTITYWNGAYNDSGSSNLTYCNKGAFGTAAICDATSSITKGSTALVTSGGVYTALGSYLPLTGGTVTDTLILSKTQDASGTANNSPALIVGGAATSTHLEIDCNEIMAKTNGTSTAALYLNNDGGQVIIGSGGLNVKGNTSVTGNVGVSGTTTLSHSDFAGQLQINRVSASSSVVSFIDYLVNSSRVGLAGFSNTFEFQVRNSSNTKILTVDSSGNMTATKLTSSMNTSTYLEGNQGKALINSTAGAGVYTMLAKMNSTNGVFTHGVYQTRYELHYTTNSMISSGANSINYNATLLDESGNSSFPGTVTATGFNGNASSASCLNTTTAIGSATNPVYFTATGIPKSCTYTLGKSVTSTSQLTDYKVSSANTDSKIYLVGTTSQAANSNGAGSTGYSNSNVFIDTGELNALGGIYFNTSGMYINQYGNIMCGVNVPSNGTWGVYDTTVSPIFQLDVSSSSRNIYLKGNTIIEGSTKVTTQTLINSGYLVQSSDVTTTADVSKYSLVEVSWSGLGNADSTTGDSWTLWQGTLVVPISYLLANTSRTVYYYARGVHNGGNSFLTMNFELVAISTGGYYLRFYVGNSNYLIGSYRVYALL